jgi:large subunit ribosomal protein L11
MAKINLLIEGGNMKPGPAIAQQLGPMGINIGKVISEVNEFTKSFGGMKVPVELDINEKTKTFTIHTSSPPTSELLKKELNIEKGTNKNREIKVANASIEDIIKIASIKLPNMLDKNIKSAVKSVLGTCASAGILVENKDPKELIEIVDEGRFDSEINSQKSETSKEKRQILKEFFSSIKLQQDAKIAAEKKAAEEAATKEEEAKKTATTPTPASKVPAATTKTDEKNTVSKMTKK